MPQTPLQAQITGPPSSPVQSSPGPIRVPALGPDKVAEYSSLFEKSGAENGRLPGLAAKNIFERARLPNDVLGRIWSLADQSGRGSLEMTEFVIAMHLLASYKSGAMRGVPSSLPPGLLDAAARRAPVRMNSVRPPSAAGQSIAALPQQLTGGQYGNMRPQSPMTSARNGTLLKEQYTGEQWLITPADKQKFDQVFNEQDRAGQGFITGEQAVQFFGNARLPEEVLASIWDLADVNSDGVLNRDEFAVAMYLIRQQRSSPVDQRGNLPQTLPLALVPPSMRRFQQQPQQTTAPDFDEAPITKPRTAADDLFGIDLADPARPQIREAVPQMPQNTGGTDPFSDTLAPSQPVQTASPLPSAATTFQPFKPSSSFGMALLPQSTGVQAQSRAIPVAESNLLDDADPVTSSKINSDAAELGNMSNQISTLSTQMTNLQQERGQHEQQLSQNSGQKDALQEQLTRLRAAYEQEAAQVRSIRDQLASSQNETKRMRQDMAMLEGGHTDLQTQRHQLQAALQADQQENAALKERMRALNAEMEEIKPQIEKLKSDSRQQKGLVAINKKQLATNELERDKLKNELAAAQKEHEDSVRDADETRRQIETSQRDLQQLRDLPKTGSVTHPQALHSPGAPRDLPHEPTERTNSVTNPNAFASSNPFFRAPESGAVFSPPMGSRITSPEPQQAHNSAFDDIFGPSASSTSGAPVTSFGHNTRDDVDQGPNSRSSTPRTVEPPPAGPANQIDSSALPLRGKLTREDSMGSSVKVAPPTSRISPVASPRTFTPDTSTTSPSSHRGNDPFTPAAADEEQESIRQAVPRSHETQLSDRRANTHATGGSVATSAADDEQESVRQALPRGETQESLKKVETLPGAFPDDAATAAEPKPSSRSVNPTAIAVGAGAATMIAGASLAAAASSSVSREGGTSTTKDNFDTFFGGPSHKKTGSEQAMDFDSAFANMGSVDNGVRPPNNEFPDIKELDADGEDDSSDDDGNNKDPKGFDDDFSGSSQPSQPMSSGKRAEAASVAPDHSLPESRPTLHAQPTTSTLPDITQQTSPPSYGESASADNPNHFPMEYKNLLPEREDPTSPPAAGGSRHPLSPPPGQVSPPLYGPEVGHAYHAPPKSQISPPPPTKASPFDFDSAFANVGEAPITANDDSDSEYDENEESRGTERHPTTFDPTFASPVLSTRTTNTTTQPAPNQNVSIYADAPRSPVNTTSVLSHTNGAASYSSTTEPPRSAIPSAAQAFSHTQTDQHDSQDPPSTHAPPPVTAGISHDWDALFAPLSGGQSATQSFPDSISNREVSSQQHQHPQVVSAQNTSTLAAPIGTTNDAATTIMSSQPSGLQSGGLNNGSLTTAPNMNIVPPSPEASKQSFSPSVYTPPPGPPPGSSNLNQLETGAALSSVKPQRPQAGRALSTGTEHDDPILKRLTAMGFERDDALQALEKFDYNIDKVSQGRRASLMTRRH